MAIPHLDHYNLDTADMDATIAFYVGGLGFTVGPRPPFEDGTAGEWFYIGDRAVVHTYRVTESKATPTGALGHVAFDADGFDETCHHLERVPYDGVDSRPTLPLRQLYVQDPNGVLVALNFRGM
jgi:catechol 2,3-dioxygenase-like lactoylglutathione lyase family enzyme